MAIFTAWRKLIQCNYTVTQWIGGLGEILSSENFLRLYGITNDVRMYNHVSHLCLTD